MKTLKEWEEIYWITWAEFWGGQGLSAAEGS